MKSLNATLLTPPDGIRPNSFPWSDYIGANIAVSMPWGVVAGTLRMVKQMTADYDQIELIFEGAGEIGDEIHLYDSHRPRVWSLPRHVL